MSDANKSLTALVNGVIRHDYYNEESITDELMKNELYASLSDEDFKILVNRARSIIKSMASSDMDDKQADVYLTSQTKKHDSGITDEQSVVFQRCWKLHRARVHQSLIDKCTWNNRLSDISWRIDIKSQSRNVKKLNQSTAIVELKLENKSSNTPDVDIVRFEVDNEGLDKMLRGLKDIDNQIEKQSQRGTDETPPVAS